MPEHPFWLLQTLLEEDMTERNLWNKISHWLHPSCQDLISSLFLWMSVMRYSNQQYYWNSLFLYLIVHFQAKKKKNQLSEEWHLWECCQIPLQNMCIIFWSEIFIATSISEIWYVGDRLCHCQENSGFAQQEWGVGGPCLLCGGCHQISHVCQAVQT